MIHKRIVAPTQMQEFYDVSETLREQCKALVLKLSQQLTNLNLEKQYLNCFKQNLKQIKPNSIKQTVEIQLHNISQNISIFNQIHIKKNKRKNIQKKLQELGINKHQIQSQSVLDQFLQLFSKLRKYTLVYVEAILKICCLYSHQNCEKKEALIKSMKRIFKKLDDQHTIIKKSNFGKLLKLGEGFDPLFLNHIGFQHSTQKSLRQSFASQRTIVKKIDNVFHFDIAYSSRLIHAHNEMLICFISKKDTCCGLDLNNQKQLKSNPRLMTQSLQAQTPQSQKNKKLAIFNNYRRKITKSLDKDPSITKRMSLKPSIQLSSHLRSKSNDIHSFQSQKSLKMSSQLQLNRGKKLNFKTVMLDPLQDKSDSSDSNMLGNNSFRAKYRPKKVGQKSIHSIKSQKIESSKSQIKKKYINFNNYQQQGGSQNKINREKSQNLIKLKQPKAFQTQQQISPRYSSEINYNKQVASCDQINQKQKKIENRARRITQVEWQNEDSPRKISVQQKQQYQKQNEKKLIDLNEVKSKHSNMQNSEIDNQPKVQKNYEDIINYNQDTQQVQSQLCPSQLPTQPTPLISNQDQKIKQKFLVSQIKQNESKIESPKRDSQKQQNQAIRKSNQKQNAQLDEISKIKVQQPSASKIIKKVQIKPTKLNFQILKEYFISHSVDHMLQNYLIQQAKRNHFYISQFYFGEELAIIVVVSYFSQRNAYYIRLWHVLPSFLQVDKTRQKFVALAFKKYIQYLQSHTSCDQIMFEGKLSEILQQNQFTLFQQNLYVRKRKFQKKVEICNQFLSVFGSMLNFKQNVKQSLLYSDEIEQFKDGKYYCNPKLFQFKKKENEDMINNCKICFIQIGDLTFEHVNQQLQKQNFDTYSFGDQIKKLTDQLYKSQNQKPNANLNLVRMCQRIKPQFIASKGHIRMAGNLVFHNNNQLICSVNLTNRHKIYFGKGFQHIISMTNKILHYKSMKTQQKQIKFWAKMFTKQLYGKIKFEENQAIYGNWQINFVWKQQIQGKVNHSLSNEVIYGQSPFFVCIQCGDEIVLGTEILQDDFLF